MNETGHPFERLSPDMVICAVESTGLVSDARILALNSYENRVYQVGIEDGEPVIVKFYRPNRWSQAQIMEEHHFSLELSELEIPVVPPQVDAQGRSLREYEGFQFAIFERKGGRSPDLDNLDNIMVMGRFLGRLHSVGKLSSFQHRVSLSVERFAENSVSWLLENDFIPPNLQVAYSSLTEDIIKRIHSIFEETANPAMIRIHGDCHMGNVLWRDDTPHFVDFDDTMTGPAIQDLWMLLSGSREQKIIQLSELVEGYNEFYDFNPAELPLIESLRTLRLMHYSAWLARRWQDPAFPLCFPWFNTENYWASHILELREQLAELDEPALALY